MGKSNMSFKTQNTQDISAYLEGTGAQAVERASRLDSRGGLHRSLSTSISLCLCIENSDDDFRVMAARCLCFPHSCLALHGSKSCVSSIRLDQLLCNSPD